MANPDWPRLYKTLERIADALERSAAASEDTTADDAAAGMLRLMEEWQRKQEAYLQARLSQIPMGES